MVRELALEKKHARTCNHQSYVEVNEDSQIGKFRRGPDQTKSDWSMVIETPGRYLVAVSAIGDGGGGTYTLQRQVFSPKMFENGSPATGDLTSGPAEVWTFTATPDDPMLLHWKSSSRNYSISIRDGDDHSVFINSNGGFSKSDQLVGGVELSYMF